jgi:hypothetical protein
MKISEIAAKIGVEEVCQIENEEFDIKKGYCCDLISEVMGRAEADSIWITVHTNMNVLAVASMLELKAVIISEGHKVDENFIKKAKEEQIALFYSDENSFILSGKLYGIGIR